MFDDEPCETCGKPPGETQENAVGRTLAILSTCRAAGFTAIDAVVELLSASPAIKGDRDLRARIAKAKSAVPKITSAQAGAVVGSGWAAVIAAVNAENAVRTK